VLPAASLRGVLVAVPVPPPPTPEEEAAHRDRLWAQLVSAILEQAAAIPDLTRQAKQVWSHAQADLPIAEVTRHALADYSAGGGAKHCAPGEAWERRKRCRE
jgi:hypothetical protein